MSPDDQRALAAMIAESIIAQSGLPAEEHRRHHDAVQRFIEREDRRAEFYEKVKAQVGGWAVVTLLGGIGYASWALFKTVVATIKVG